MEVIATNKLKLEPFRLPFAYSFSHKKRGNEEAWFTPSGKAKIWFGGLNTEKVGNITPEEEKALHKEMKEAKADVLWAGGDSNNRMNLYTTCGNITRLPDVIDKIKKLLDEWEARYEWEQWTIENEKTYGNYN